MTVSHGEFAAERLVAAPVEQVWAAYARPDLRARWRRVPGARSGYEASIKVGGHERSTGRVGEELVELEAVILDLAVPERMVWSYRVAVDHLPRWASLVTATLTPVEGGTLVRHVEQYSFLDEPGEHDVPHLRGSGPLQLDRLAAVVEVTPSR